MVVGNYVRNEVEGIKERCVRTTNSARLNRDSEQNKGMMGEKKELEQEWESLKQLVFLLGRV